MGGANSGARDYEIRERNMPSDVTDVYICVFFDGTGNNMYEQIHRKNKVKKEELFEVVISYAISDSLFSTTKTDFSTSISINPKLYSQSQKCVEEKKERESELDDYAGQRSQAEQDYTINQQRNSGNGGWKYSNVAVLRSLTKNKEQFRSEASSDKKVIGVNYNLYIEGAGKFWDDQQSLISLGMGTGKTGVVGLVSKAVIFVTHFINSFISKDRRASVQLHFAVFGFSRGSACARLFSFLMVDNPNSLGNIAIQEFRHYLPEPYWKSDQLNILEDYSKENRSVDFLGVYDTVASIGFLRKEDTSTNYGLNSFGKKWFGQKGDNVNRLHGLFRISGSDAANNWHCDNVTNYGLYSPHNKNVKHTFHICAMDEYRENFALVDLGTDMERCTEVFIPGCHSDIGGGYMNEDRIDRYTLRRKIKGKPTKLINWDPRNPIMWDSKIPMIDSTRDLSQSILKELGWLDRTTSKKKETYSFTKVEENGHLTEKRAAQTTYIYEVEDKVEFERFVEEGYSNISLDMMIKRTINKNFGLKSVWPDVFIPFSGNLPERFKIPNDPVLDSVKIECNKDFAEGKRTWICPPLDEYIEIRRKYIHFTCTDELNLEKRHWNASGANIGNAPNWRKDGDYYLLCRLIYKGDNGERGLHYMDK